MVMPDGTQVPLGSLAVRATEFTVGTEGLAAMPAELPPMSGYTYALELSADEAITAGAVSVDFDQTLVQYVENFLDFPVGGPVPVGYYDRQRASWIAADNGRIVEVLGVDPQGRAELDIDGSGEPADPAELAALGVTDDERIEVASRYPTGTTLWRVPIPHFTPWDCNWPYGPPSDAEEPPDPERPREDSDPEDDDAPGRDEDKPRCQRGSLIECENQALRETISLVGTPLNLHYNSARTPGHKVASRLEATLSLGSVPASLDRIRLTISIAGRRFQTTIAPAANLKYIFDWDGLDSYGRLAIGSREAQIDLDYIYPAVYYESDTFPQTFARPSPSLTVLRELDRAEVVFRKSFRTRLRAPSFESGDFGWTLSNHHRYDPASRTLYLGNGEKRTADDVAARVVKALPGATSLTRSAWDIIQTPAGDVLFSYSAIPWVYRLAPDGSLTNFAGSGAPGNSGDGGPATDARFQLPRGLAIGRDGSVYIVDTLNHRVRRVDPDGIITAFAGTGTAGFSGDGGSATAAQLSSPQDVVVAPDNSVWISDGNHRIRRVDPSGIISTVAGAGGGPLGDGGPAAQAHILGPNHLAFGPDGALYLSQGLHRVRRIGLDGVIETVAGNGVQGFNGDGGPATQAEVADPRGVALDSAGNLFIGHSSNNGPVSERLRRVGQDGVIQTVGGGGSTLPDGVPALGARLLPEAMSFAADGDLLVTNAVTAPIVLRITNGFEVLGNQELAIPAAVGEELYIFDTNGRHLRTVNVLTGSDRWTFNYDPEGLLIAVIDAFGNTTVIERNPGGEATAIVGPYGHRNELDLDPNGYLSSITTPEGLATTLTYSQEGLLETMTDPRDGIHTYTYTALGRLIRDENAGGGFKELSRTVIDGGHRVVLTSLLGESTTYESTLSATGDRLRRMTRPDGFSEDTLIKPDGTRSVDLPDGTQLTARLGPDPRFGMQKPILLESSVATPSGLQHTTTRARNAVLTDPLDPLSLETLSDTWTINGRSYAREYNALTREVLLTTPEGRQTTLALDQNSRPILIDLPGSDAVRLSYDSRGRLDTIRQGSGAAERVVDLDYDLLGRLDPLTDPLARVTDFVYDDDDRPLSAILPGGRAIAFSYDGNGNLQTLTPPARPAHALDYTPDDLQELYDPPDVGVSPDTTTHLYDQDRRLETIVRPDGGMMTLQYNLDRLSQLSFPTGSISYGYSTSTGRLETITGPGGQIVTYGYDGFLLTSRALSGQVSGLVEHTYTDDFWLQSESVNSANTVTYEYDDDGLIEQVGALDVHRDPITGIETGTTLGLVTTFLSTDSVFGELTGLSASVSGTEIFRIDYPVRDKLGRIVERTETIGGVTDTYLYSYDTAGRLKGVTKNGMPLASYTYDDSGNRLTYDGPFGTIGTTTYDDQDRVLAYGGTTFTYSANGELASRTENAQTATYTYDALGNLRAVSLPDGVDITYLVDGVGRRVGKKVEGILVQGFLYRDALNPVAELDGSGAIVSRFVYGIRANVPDYIVKGGTTYRILADHIGSVRLVVNVATGSVQQRLDYDEYGRITQDSSPGFQPFGFGGGLYDHHTGLVRFGVRDYEPLYGRWTAKDPILFGGGSLNLYRYAQNDPVNAFDPNGLRVENKCKCTIFVKPEGTGEAIPLRPGEVYEAGQDGVATPDRPGWVFKTVDGVDVTVNDDAEVTTDANVTTFPLSTPYFTVPMPTPGSAERLVGQAFAGWKDRDWLDGLHSKDPPDHGWDALFDSVPASERPDGSPTGTPGLAPALICF